MTATDTRTPGRQLRSPAYRGRVAESSPTRGPSPSLVEFGEAARALFKAPFAARADRMASAARAIRESRYPEQCANILVDEAVCRGGPDGLDMAAAVLARVPVPLLRVIESYFLNDSSRRRRDRRLDHPRYRTADEAWAVMLDALGRTDPAAVPTAAVLATFRRVGRSATAGMRSGLAAAAVSLADRGPDDHKRAVAFLNRMLAPGADGRELSAAARRGVEGALADLEG